jgi:type VI protein secretion system component Hcp
MLPMRKPFIVFLFLLPTLGFGQYSFLMDIPKIDGESTVNIDTRVSLTKKPKAKNTKISSFSFSSSKAIYLGSSGIKKDFKAADFQPIEIQLPIDKSITEWHERIFRGSTLPTLDLFMDKNGTPLTEVLHIKLFNVSVKQLSYGHSLDIPEYILTLNYDKIIYAVSKINTSGALIGVNQTCFDIKNGTTCTDTF